MHAVPRFANCACRLPAQRRLCSCLFVCWNKTRKAILRLLCREGSKPPGSDDTRAEAQTTCLTKIAAQTTYLSMYNTLSELFSIVYKLATQKNKKPQKILFDLFQIFSPIFWSNLGFLCPIFHQIQNFRSCFVRIFNFYLNFFSLGFFWVFLSFAKFSIFLLRMPSHVIGCQFHRPIRAQTRLSQSIGSKLNLKFLREKVVLSRIRMDSGWLRVESSGWVDKLRWPRASSWP